MSTTDTAPADVADASPVLAPDPHDGRAPRWLAFRDAATRPRLLLGLVVALYAGFFGVMTWRQHANFASAAYDTGIYDQALWLLSRFEEPFLTVRGMNYFGHHANLSTILLVPAYWLGAGPQFLYLVQTAALALGAVPIFLLARDRLHSERLGAVLGVAYLLHPTLGWINRMEFHPDAFLVPLILFGYWFATHRRWRWFGACVVLALLTKEDAALAVAALGVVFLVRRWWRPGLVLLASGIGWFFLVTKVVIPRANGGLDPFYGELFAGYGTSATEILRTIVTKPTRLLRDLTEQSRLEYYWHLFAPVAYLAVLAWPVLLVALPQLLVNAITSHTWARDPRFYYSAVPLAVIFVATVEGFAAVADKQVRRRLALLVLAAAVVTNVAWSPGPVGRGFGTWAEPDGPRHAAIRRAMRMVPADAGVSASYDVVPHMSHRVDIYDWPEPFVTVSWGMKGSPPPDPDRVDYIVVDSTARMPKTDGVFESLTAPTGDFEVVFEEGPISLAKRKAAS